MKREMLLGDSLVVLSGMRADSIDSVVTDPPYGLSFGGADWDRSVPGPEYWTAIKRVAKPGAHLLAFGGTRVYHHMVTAIEDAGWEIRDCLMWLYGTGCPKTPTLDGDWSGWSTSLKPGWEPIVLARKPFTGRLADCLSDHGTGAINIDVSRIEIDERDADPAASGRWPANVLLDSIAADLLDAQRPGSSRFFYVAKPSGSERDDGLDSISPETVGIFGSRKPPTKRNVHPTVKPVRLMRYLVSLVTRPGGVVLDPFSGSGTTGVAAAREGMGFVGIERDPKFHAIASARIASESDRSGLFQGLV